MEHNLYDSVSVATCIDAIVVNNDTEGKGVAVDLAGYETALVIVQCGISADTLSGSVLHTFKLQESATTTDGDFTDVAAADMEGTQSTVIDDAAEDPATIVWGYKGSQRYIRVFDDTTGTHTNGTPIAAVVVKGRPRHVGGIA